MDEMLALLGDHLPCFLFWQLFLQHLPEDMRTQVLDANIHDCRQLARRAGRIWAARQMTSYANSVQTEPGPALEHIMRAALMTLSSGIHKHHQSTKGDSTPLQQHPAFATTTVCMV